MEFLTAAFLGVVEGLTEFLPVSSTGHLILFVDLLGFKGPPGRVFEVVIQLGAIAAIVILYWRKFLDVGLHLNRPDARHFAGNIILAIVPAILIGVLAHAHIKALLFNPLTVAIALILGGVAILLIERNRPEPTIHSTEEMSYLTALKIGLFQCIAMIPGVSRSGATIMGALLCGVDRKTAAEFSFFLAVPTMLAATTYDLYKNHASIDLAGASLILVGFLSAFATALLIVRWLLAYVQHHSYAVFAWYRIALGMFILGLLM
jgi:undecaprenyl-diphosphatase